MLSALPHVQKSQTGGMTNQRFGDQIWLPFLKSTFYKGSMQMEAFKNINQIAASEELRQLCAFSSKIENILFTNTPRRPHPHTLLPSSPA